VDDYYFLPPSWRRTRRRKRKRRMRRRRRNPRMVSRGWHADGGKEEGGGDYCRRLRC
jgi:hypothetical protein